MDHCKESEHLEHSEADTLRNQQRTLWVIVISFITMVAEIIAGNLTGSMGLLADGWHMASHVAALLLSYLVYRLASSRSFSRHFTFGTAKLFSLGGYTSAIGLTFIAFYMAYESVIRFFNPVAIEFNEALIVCVIGLLVNVVCALIMKDDHHHDHEHHDHAVDHAAPVDHNHESAFAHIVADAITSVAAIAALLIGKYFQISWADPIIGILGSLMILKWSYSLIKNTAYELLDGETKHVDVNQIRDLIEAEGGKVIDFHAWGVGSGKIAAIISVATPTLKGSDHYRAMIENTFHFSHLVIEETLKS